MHLLTNLVFVVIKLLLKGSILLVGLGLTKINTTLNRWDKMNKNTEKKKLAWSKIVLVQKYLLFLQRF